MKVNVSKYIGFCFGVDEAIGICDQISENVKRPLQMLGDLVHNELVVNELKKKGIKVISSIDEARGGTVIITAHGIYPEVIRKAKELGLNIIDTTCPKVTLVHQLARKLEREGRRIIIVGDANHVEIKGINGAVGWKACVVSTVREAKDISLKPQSRVGVVSQTTQDVKRFNKIVSIIKERFTDVKVFDTICDSTKSRQEEAEKMAKKNDVMVIVGSKNSANTRRLYEISKSLNKNTYRINSSSDLNKDWFSQVGSIGITTGASTSKKVAIEVLDEIKKL
jgi:4-hydroxy-3-methylbut-2-enyl diphosphate reductase